MNYTRVSVTPISNLVIRVHRDKIADGLLLKDIILQSVEEVKRDRQAMYPVDMNKTIFMIS